MTDQLTTTAPVAAIAPARVERPRIYVACLAAFFGVTELLVRRVLALASLSEPIRKLYAEDEIDRETIRALTLATEDQQAEWLRLYESEDEREPRGRNCKAWITGGAIITTDKALFDVAEYDGQITADLFGENGVFADPEAFWKAQSAAVAQRVEDYIADGWTDVICLERGAFFHRWDHQTRTKRQGGKVFVELRHEGTVTFNEGYISHAEARRQEQVRSGGGDAPAAPAKPEMSGQMAEYILLHRHGAAQASLAAQPAIALRLLVAHAMTGSALWPNPALSIPPRCRKQSLATGSPAMAATPIPTGGPHGCRCRQPALSRAQALRPPTHGHEL